MYLVEGFWAVCDGGNTDEKPGRKEPTIGEIDYNKIFGHLHRKGYTDMLL